jgi:hypothetical protein
MSRITSPLVIVDDLYIVSIAGTPSEANAPLIIDPDTVLTSPVAFQDLQPVARRNAEKVKSRRGIDLQQLPMRNSLYVGRESSTVLAPKELFRVSIRKALDHRARVRPTSP